MKIWMSLLLFILPVCVFAQLPPGVDPGLDATGVLGQLADAEDANIAERQAIVEGIELDHHPVYGKITSEMFPVSKSGFQMCQLEEIVPAGTKDVNVESVSFSGLGLVQHRVGDEDIYVWHRMEDAQLARITFPDPAGGSANRIVIINSQCGNAIVITLCDELDPYCNWLYHRFD